MCPCQSPHLSPIEQIWSIVKEKLAFVEDVTSVPLLVKHTKEAWALILPSILDNLISSIPQHIAKSIENDGEHIRTF